MWWYSYNPLESSGSFALSSPYNLQWIFVVIMISDTSPWSWYPMSDLAHLVSYSCRIPMSIDELQSLRARMTAGWDWMGPMGDSMGFFTQSLAKCCFHWDPPLAHCSTPPLLISSGVVLPYPPYVEEKVIHEPGIAVLTNEDSTEGVCSFWTLVTWLPHLSLECTTLLRGPPEEGVVGTSQMPEKGVLRWKGERFGDYLILFLCMVWLAKWDSKVFSKIVIWWWL